MMDRLEQEIEKIKEHKKAIEQLVYDILKENPNMSFETHAYKEYAVEGRKKEDFRCLFISLNNHL